MRSIFLIAACSLSLAAVHAQQPMGVVATRDALVTGGLEVRGEQAQLLTNASITAYDRTAAIELTRGGDVLVCSTSQFHLLRSGNEAALLFALDRGAIELHGKSQPQDVIQTPDLRFTFASQGDLDLRLRVTSNGDTCVENTGGSAPQLVISDVFSDVNYRLQPGQHVLFEHGSLKEVVDNERSSCGCPAAQALPSQELAQGASGSGTQVEARNPFPSAVSQGLAPETKPANNTVGETHTQVSSTLAYTPSGEVTSAAAPATTAQSTSLAPPPSPPGASDLAHAIGRFFHRLFHGKASETQAK